MNSEPTFQAEAPAKKVQKQSAIATVFDYLELFAWSIFAVMMLFTLVFRICRVDGSSMENTLVNGENLLIWSVGYTPEQDDIVVFHLPEKEGQNTLVKRVIATSGQTVKIDFKNKEIFVDGVRYKDTHAVLKNIAGASVDRYTLFAEHNYDPDNKIFYATVPEGHVFVMGDNRNNSKDSRDYEIAFVDERCVLGKAILRIFPFTVYP